MKTPPRASNRSDKAPQQFHINMHAPHKWVLPATSTMSPGTMSLALILWTLFRSCRYTLPISGSYSLRASIAFSAFLSYKTAKMCHFESPQGKNKPVRSDFSKALSYECYQLSSAVFPHTEDFVSPPFMRLLTGNH